MKNISKGNSQDIAIIINALNLQLDVSIIIKISVAVQHHRCYSTGYL